jgi:uncharacterized protein (DUF1501 family)
MSLSRRGLLGSTGAALALGAPDLPLRAAETDQRFVLVFLRGGMDGMGAVVPYGDPDLTRLRPALVPPQPGRPNGLLDLGGFWGLHPGLAGLHGLYAAGQALPIQAVASPDRSRSHFEAQDRIEMGASERLTTGWISRLAALLPAREACDAAVNLGRGSPLIMRGPAPTMNCDPFHPRPHVSAGFYRSIVAMHAQDPETAAPLADGLHEREYMDHVLAGLAYNGLAPGFPRLCRAAARLLLAADGPRIAELEVGGWDTHAAQLSALTEALRTLDQGLVELHQGLQPVWSETTILVLTEFGRTAHVNGSAGTDHGTATAAFLLGGRIAGGRVMADWPGLAPSRLFENRDLQPTLDIRAVAKAVLGRQFALSPEQLGTVFPDSGSLPPATGLFRA